jgi:hypothetical protein
MHRTSLAILGFLSTESWLSINHLALWLLSSWLVDHKTVVQLDRFKPKSGSWAPQILSKSRKIF